MDIETNMTVFVACLLLLFLACLSACVATKKRKEQSTTATAAAVRKGEVATRLFHAPSLGSSVHAATRAANAGAEVPATDRVALVQMTPDGDYLPFNHAMADTVDLHARVVHHVIEKTNKWLLVWPDTTTKHAC